MTRWQHLVTEMFQLLHFHREKSHLFLYEKGRFFCFSWSFVHDSSVSLTVFVVECPFKCGSHRSTFTDISGVFRWSIHTECRTDVVAVWGVRGADPSLIHTEVHRRTHTQTVVCVLAALKTLWDGLLHQLCTDTQEHQGPGDSTHMHTHRAQITHTQKSSSVKQTSQQIRTQTWGRHEQMTHVAFSLCGLIFWLFSWYSEESVSYMMERGQQQRHRDLICKDHMFNPQQHKLLKDPENWNSTI